MKKLAANSNKYLRLKHDGRYRGGARYREYEILVDLPELRVGEPDADPPHAIAGDVLREKRHDRNLTPFELSRDGWEIGTPEMWQVSHLFTGLFTDGSDQQAAAESRGLLRPDTLRLQGRTIDGYTFLHAPEQQCWGGPIESGGFLARYGGGRCGPMGETFYPWTVWPDRKRAVGMFDVMAEKYVELDRVLRDPRYDRPRHLVRAWTRPVATLDRAIGTHQIGDILVQSPERPALPGLVTPMCLDDYEEFRSELVDTPRGGRLLTELHPFTTGTVRRFLTDRRKWGRGRKVWTPRLWRVRYPVEPVSNPIDAPSDDHALFELLWSVGGRMPAEVAGKGAIAR